MNRKKKKLTSEVLNKKAVAERVKLTKRKTTKANPTERALEENKNKEKMLRKKLAKEKPFNRKISREVATKELAIKNNHISKVQDTKKSLQSRHEADFPIVGLGASAGGLQALEEFFKNIPEHTCSDITYIVVIHLDPRRTSLLPELIQRATPLKVLQISNDEKIKPGNVYVIPPGQNVYIKQGSILKLIEQKKEKLNLPIDIFFESLAMVQDRKIIGIILSGTGLDGTHGIKAINAAGGLVIAQEIRSAKYTGMPASAIETGLVDYVLPPSKMPQQIFNDLQYNWLDKVLKEGNALKSLQPIFNIIRTKIGHDFSMYKYNTICRRIEKRMNLHQINSIQTYIRYLQHNPHEIETLFKDLLIGVTNFFRNPEAFDLLKQAIINKLIKQRGKNNTLRIWVPGCASGEEVYSLAILLHECMEQENLYCDVQIFGTDIDEAAIEIARAGIYPASILADVNLERLKRYFTHEDKMYKISKDIRKIVIFAIQNVIKDPPFTKLDLLSCRNLLIYFTAELQKKLLPVFHYSLNNGGILFLGSAENIAGFTDLFNTVDKKWKIFERREAHLSALQTVLEFPTQNQIDKMDKPMKAKTKLVGKITNLAQSIETMLLANYAPTCIIVTETGDIVYIYGRTGKYLEPPPGAATLNVLQMARSGLKLKLHAALLQLSSEKKQVTYNNLQIKVGELTHYINLKVSLLKEFEPKKTGGLSLLKK